MYNLNGNDQYIDLARAKSDGIKINKSNQQKNKFARAARFFLSLSLFCTTTTTKAGLFPPHPFFKGKALGTRLFLKKSGRPCDFFPNKTLSCIWVAIPVDWIILHWYACGTDGRCTVTWLPNFLGWVVYHIFLPMVLRCARESSAMTSHSKLAPVPSRNMVIWGRDCPFQSEKRTVI